MTSMPEAVDPAILPVRPVGATTVRPVNRTKRNIGAKPEIKREFGPELVAELEALVEISRWTEPAALVLELTNIGMGMLLVAQMPLAAPAVAVALGIRGRAIGNVMHDAQHGTASSIPRVNSIVGNVAACVTNNSFTAYHAEHKPHHGHVGEDGDPKLASYVEKGFTDVSTPWTRQRVAKELARASAIAVRDSLHGAGRKKGEVREIAGRSIDGRETATGRAVRVTCWLGGATAGLLIGGPVPVLTYFAAMLILKPVINTVTDVFNHAGLIPFETDPVRQTRGFTGGPIVRLVFGAYIDDLVHFVHHFCSRIPWRNKKKAAALILSMFERADEIPLCDGIYFPRRPYMPPVCQDIADRLQAQHLLFVTSGRAYTDRT